MSSLISVGAGAEQIPAILKARSLGYAVVAVDANPTAPGLRVADHGVVADLQDEADVVSIAKRFEVSATLPVPIGRFLTTQAAIHDELKLRGVSRAAAVHCVDKQAFHACLLNAGAAVPAQWSYASLDEVKASGFREDELPLVLKPRFGSGSSGVVVLSAAREWSRVRDSLEPRHYAGGVVIQSFVEGLALGIDGAVQAGEVSLTLVREKVLTPVPNRVELSYRAPARLPLGADVVLGRVLQQALLALGVDESVFHADAIWTADHRPVLIELSARPAGLVIASQMVPACTGVDFLAQAIHLHATGTATFEGARFRPTLLHYWNHSGGVVHRVPSAAELFALPHVIAANVGVRAGQHLRSPRTIDDIFTNGYLLISADTWQDVDATADKALSLFVVGSCRDVA